MDEFLSKLIRAWRSVVGTKLLVTRDEFVNVIERAGGVSTAAGALFDNIVEEGSSGATWKPGNVYASHLLQHIKLKHKILLKALIPHVPESKDMSGVEVC